MWDFRFDPTGWVSQRFRPTVGAIANAIFAATGGD